MSRLSLPLIPLVVAFSSSVAAAQAPGEIAPTNALEQPPEVKSPTTAVGMSIGFTLGGLALMSTTPSTGGAGALGGVALLYLGPSTGRWYAGETGGATLALRAVGGVAMVSGLVMVLQQEDGGDCLDLSPAQCDAADAQSRRDGQLGAGLMLGGAALWIGTTAWDIVMAGRDADKFNHKHTAMRLAPMLSTATSGHRTVGLSLEARF